MTKLLVVPKIEAPARVAVTNEAGLAKVALLQVANAIVKVENEQARDFAIRSASKIRAHMDEVEKARVEVKDPFWQMGKSIDDVAKTHIAELATQLRRINQLVGSFEENRRAAIAAEEAKLKREAAELAEKTQQSLPPSATADPAATLRIQLENEERLAATEEKLEGVRVAKEETKPSGGQFRQDWDIQVTDIKALYLAHPQCVKMEVRNLAVKDLLKAGIVPPGIIATPKSSYNVRAAGGIRFLR